MTAIANNTIDLKEYNGFLNEEQCRKIIEMGEPYFQKAGVLGEQTNDFRVADTHFFDPSLKSLMKIREVIAKVTKVPIENQEAMSIIRYNVGGEFKAHHDCFSPAADYYKTVIAQGGQRIKTCLIYLNEDFEGGETDFPNIPYKVKPKTGKLAMFNSIDDNGGIIPQSLHAGLPVTKGVKYLATIWIRERPFVAGGEPVKYD